MTMSKQNGRPSTPETTRRVVLQPTRRRLRRAALSGSILLALGACTITTEAVSDREMAAQAEEDFRTIFQEQEPLDGPVSLSEAMARALRYNLDRRLKVMEEALAQNQIKVASLDMLPRLAGEAGYVNRSSPPASSSRSVLTGTQSLEPSTSQDQERRTGSLAVAWNILDFGVGYLGARQQANRAWIAAERRRKVIHNIIQDVRDSYFRAVAADRLLARIDPMIERTEGALAESEEAARRQLQAPLDALTYQRGLLNALRQLLDIKRDLIFAKAQLAALMNLPPGSDFSLVMPAPDEQAPPEMPYTPDQIERVALQQRPELREEMYQRRVGVDETRRALLRMLPGLEFEYSLNHDNNSFLVENTWRQLSFTASWNLMNIISGPVRIQAAEAVEEVNEARRLALAMAVLTQAHVSFLRYREARARWETAKQMSEVEDAIRDQVETQVASGRTGELEAISRNVNAAIGTLRRDLAYADLQNAAGQILVTMGIDQVPKAVEATDLDSLASAIEAYQAALMSGEAQAVTAAAAAVGGTSDANAPAGETGADAGAIPTAGDAAAAPEAAGTGPSPAVDADRPSTGSVIRTSNGGYVRMGGPAG